MLHYDLGFTKSAFFAMINSLSKLLAGISLVCYCMISHAAAPAAIDQTDSLAACRLPEMHVRSDVGLGFPRNPFRLKALGEVRLTVLFVDFSDVPATISPQQAMSIISPEAEKYFDAVSYGKLRLSLVPHYQWLRMNRTSADYHFARGASFATHRTYLQEAVQRAGTHVDYSQTDAILVIANPAVKAIDYGPAFTAAPGYGIQAGGRELLNGATSGSDLSILGWPWFSHEISHALSLVDLAGPLPGTQDWHTYVGEFSVTGDPAGKAKELLAWERWQLGWLDDSQVLCAEGQKLQVRLTPIERRGGNKAVIIPTGKTTAIVVESRRAEGYDRDLPRPGLLVYTIDTRLTSHQGAIRVQKLNGRAGDTRHRLAPLQTGETLRLGKTSISNLGSDANGDLLQIETMP